jgi:carbamate kinase
VRIVAAVGGNALLERGEPPDAEIQQRHIRIAIDALAPLARSDQLVVTHGNGPQVGLLARESAADLALARPYPLDVLGAQTQGMIGYWLLQGLQNAVPGREIASVITQTLVSATDPAFADLAKFVGPVYPEAEARRIAAERGWTVKADGDVWRRVVASPQTEKPPTMPITIRAPSRLRWRKGRPIVDSDLPPARPSVSIGRTGQSEACPGSSRATYGLT